VAFEDDLKDQGLNHFLQKEFANQIMNMILQNQHCRLLDEYIIEGDDYANWLQWVVVEKSEKTQGSFCQYACV